MSARSLAINRRRTVLAVFILFGNLRGRESRVRRVTAEDVSAVNAFIAKAQRGPASFGFASKKELYAFRDALLAVRRAVSAARLSDAENGRLASTLVGPVVEKFAYLHPAFRRQLVELADLYVDVVNKQLGKGVKFYDGTGTEISKPPRLSRSRTYLATNVRLVHEGKVKEFTDFLVLAFAGEPANFVKKDGPQISIAVSNENKAPSVVSESNYQHANAAARLGKATAILYVIDGKEYRAEPANFFTSQSAFHEVTLSLKGRFGGTTRVYANDDPEDWLHSMRTHIPKGDRSAQLRMVLSVRREALLGLIR
ncbi:hypothetical protein [Arenimonas terrae]|uniref:Uncharacterized protein n=1 Tax=Arenimonas terrae TaxID=2546226 RepID=A0A5C4RPQ5_9GAMM|nr:hypothetical protein [Arenimonas terrae]TNJ32909.1 hypothetical protein E1B00_14455 [Arenimonas terrae]